MPWVLEKRDWRLGGYLFRLARRSCRRRGQVLLVEDRSGHGSPLLPRNTITISLTTDRSSDAVRVHKWQSTWRRRPSGACDLQRGVVHDGRRPLGARSRWRFAAVGLAAHAQGGVVPMSSALSRPLPVFSLTLVLSSMPPCPSTFSVTSTPLVPSPLITSPLFLT
jgi:hypothetical protein